MTRRLTNKTIVLIREGWAGKVIHCPWMFHYDKKGFQTCLSCHNTLRKLFPNETYNIKVFSFNHGAETEHPFDVNDLQ